MKKSLKKIMSVAVAASMCCTALWQGSGVSARADEDVSGNVMSPVSTEAVKADLLYNPVYNYETEQMEFSYIYFGSYPQSEVTGEALTEAIVSAEYVSGEAVVEGVKYRRLKEEDAYYSYTKYIEGKSEEDIEAIQKHYYIWETGEDYHYFKYEPIKWRVMDIEDGKALLLADKILDHRTYHSSGYPNGVRPMDAWLISDIRMWMNGYVDLTSSFLTDAFDEAEQQILCERFLGYEDCWVNTIWEGNDKVFLLSLWEFARAGMDEQITPPMQISDYAFSNGARMEDVAKLDSGYDYEEGKRYGNWWLRDELNPDIACVDAIGIIHDETGPFDSVLLGKKDGIYRDSVGVGVCPAIWLDLSDESLWEAEAPLTKEEVEHLEAYVPTPTPTSTPQPSPTLQPTGTIPPTGFTEEPVTETPVTPSEEPIITSSPMVTPTPMISPTPTVTPTPAPSELPLVSKGDMDGDGKISLNDAQRMLRGVLKIEPFTEQEKLAADLYDDGQFTLERVQLVLKFALKIVDYEEMFPTVLPSQQPSEPPVVTPSASVEPVESAMPSETPVTDVPVVTTSATPTPAPSREPVTPPALDADYADMYIQVIESYGYDEEQYKDNYLLAIDTTYLDFVDEAGIDRMVTHFKNKGLNAMEADLNELIEQGLAMDYSDNFEIVNGVLIGLANFYREGDYLVVAGSETWGGYSGIGYESIFEKQDDRWILIETKIEDYA